MMNKNVGNDLIRQLSRHIRNAIYNGEALPNSNRDYSLPNANRVLSISSIGYIYRRNETAS